MKVDFYVRSVYGSDRMYVKDETQAKAIFALTKQKTLSPENLRALRFLGVEMNQILPPLPEKFSTDAPAEPVL